MLLKSSFDSVGIGQYGIAFVKVGSCRTSKLGDCCYREMGVILFLVK